MRGAERGGRLQLRVKKNGEKEGTGDYNLFYRKQIRAERL